MANWNDVLKLISELPTVPAFQKTGINPSALSQWVVANKARDFGDIRAFYDYIGAYKGGVKREKGEEGHFSDTYKLPGHPSFSNESMYYEPWMKAGYWQGEDYVPAYGFEMPKKRGGK